MSKSYIIGETTQNALLQMSWIFVSFMKQLCKVLKCNKTVINRKQFFFYVTAHVSNPLSKCN